MKILGRISGGVTNRAIRYPSMVGEDDTQAANTNANNTRTNTNTNTNRNTNTNTITNTNTNQVPLHDRRR